MQTFASLLQAPRYETRSFRPFLLALPVMGCALFFGYHFGFATQSPAGDLPAASAPDPAAQTAPAPPAPAAPEAETAPAPAALAGMPGSGFLPDRLGGKGPEAETAATPAPAEPSAAAADARPTAPVADRNPLPDAEPLAPAAQPSPAAQPPLAPAEGEGIKGLKAASYTVESGDSLTRVGKKFRIPFELVQRLNGMAGTNLRVGQTLAVVEGPFDVEVSKESRRMTVLLKGAPVKTYSVGIGKDNLTPASVFKVQKKMIKPAWTNPENGRVYVFGEEGYRIGTRWIEFAGGLGIHGTDDESSIGQAMSLGCIRMKNAEVEEVYDFLSTPSEGRGEATTVTIRD